MTWSGGHTGTLTAFRWSTYDVPFWARDNSRPGRWHGLGDGPTQYLSLSPAGAWAELIRHEELRSEADLDGVSIPLWVARLRCSPIIDLRRVDVQAHYDVSSDVLVAPDWTPTQQLGARLRLDGAAAVVPSAALPGEANLVVFGPRRAIDWGSTSVLASTVPATVASLGRPPVGLVERVVRVDSERPESEAGDGPSTVI